MDEVTFIATLMKYMDPVAVIVGAFMTGLVKYLLRVFDPLTAHLDSGRLFARLLPIMPVVFSVLWLLIVGPVFGPKGLKWRDLAALGAVSGIASAYAYRTFRVAVLGE